MTKQTMIDQVLDTLINAMEFWSKEEFIDLLQANLKFTPQQAERAWVSYWDMDAMLRFNYLPSDWQDWLETHQS